MKTKFLYFNGIYVYTNEELKTKVQELIDKGEHKDSLIRLLSDLYRNGHLCEFCQQEEYGNGVEKKDYKISFDDNLTGDIRIANHVAGRLIGDDNYTPFYGDFHKHFTFSSISISRQIGLPTNDQTVLPIRTIAHNKNKDCTTSVFLLDGFRKIETPHQKVSIDITYSIDNKEALNEEIPIYINGNKAEITLDLSHPNEKQKIEVPIQEAILDPTRNIEVWFGQDGCYGQILLKAPQIEVPIRFDGQTFMYPMMRINRGIDHYFYIGIFPFEHNNIEEWKEIVDPHNFLYDEYYAKRKIDFFMRINNATNVGQMRNGGFIKRFEIADFSLFDFSKDSGWRIDVPFKREWEYAARITESRGSSTDSAYQYYLIGDAVLQKNDNETYSLCQHELQARFTPNAYGIYAMLGNIYEFAIDGTDAWYMGGDLFSLEDKSGSNDHSKRVPFFGIRFVIHDRVFAENEFN